VIHHTLDSREAITIPHIVYFVPLRGTRIRMAYCPETPKEESQNYPSLNSEEFARSYLFAQTSDLDEV